MPKIIVLGAGACGLATAMLLVRDGHDVTVLERDADPPASSPEDAWDDWERGGVSQFRLPHYIQARGSTLLQRELPDVAAALVTAGATVLDPVASMPASVRDRAPRDGDDRLTTITARRPMFEHVFAEAAQAEPRLTLRRGVPVNGLTARPGARTPHITGVRTETGEQLAADLVVDAMGRRSVSPGWLREAGAEPVEEEAEDSGFIYYGRYFRSLDGSVPEPLTLRLTPIGSFSILTIPSEHGTWSVTVYISSGDRALKRLRDEEVWTALVRSCPLHAHWLDGEPVTDILAMGGVLDKRRRFVSRGRPVATGFAAVADAWACTNPSLGRGIALGLMHAVCLRDVVRSHLDDPERFAEAFDERTEREVAPWYRATVEFDRARLAEMEAIRMGLDGDPAAAVRAGIQCAVRHDADVFRATLEIASCVSLPTEVFSRPGLGQRIMEAAAAHPDDPPLGPGRDELLRLVGEPAAA